MSERKSVFWISFILVVIGFFTLLSASMTYLAEPEKFSRIILVQGISIILGYFSIIFILKWKSINYLNLQKYSFWIFLVALALQLLILSPLGVEKNFATRWLNLGIIIQPSEIFRFAFIIFYAKLLFEFQKNINDWKTFRIFFVILIPIFLFYGYVKDLGSLMIFIAAISSMFLFTKAAKKYFLSLFALLIIGGIPMVLFSSHANQRLTTFYNVYFAPEKLDYRGDYYQSYNLIKAVGAGGVWGIGYGGSIQKLDKRLPESVSDSIFSIFAEEWGFVFSTFLILIYTALAYSIFSGAQKIKNFYQKIVVVGLGVNIIFPVYYNILTVIGLAPLSGIPLTFMSKGGTSILMSLVSLGVILLFLPKK